MGKMVRNFEMFKDKLQKMLIIKDERLCDNEWYQDLYVAFKEGENKYIEGWAKIWFADVSLDTHSFELRKSFK